MKRLSGHFIASLYRMIFEQDPPCMSQEEMQALFNIAECYASHGGTFIRMFGLEKPSHELPRFATNKLVMQEVAYHIFTGLSIGLHRRKKASSSTMDARLRFCTSSTDTRTSRRYAGHPRTFWLPLTNMEERRSIS